MSTDENAMRALEAEVAAVIQRHAEQHAKDEGQPLPFVVAWAVAYEATSVDLQAERSAARNVIVPDDQTVSASTGLGHFLQRSFEPVWS